MALHLPEAFSTTVQLAAPFDRRRPRPGLLGRLEPEPHRAASNEPDGPSHAPRRTRIVEYDSSLHCSIIVTCLTTAELRHILDKLKINGASTASDHELHTVGVMLAGRRDGGAKFIHKALDRQHRTAITRYSSAKDPAAVL